MRLSHIARALSGALFLPGHHHLTAWLTEGRVMDSWYVSAVPAALALAIVGYSFFLAYA